jgi:hypothetical protein
MNFDNWGKNYNPLVHSVLLNDIKKRMKTANSNLNLNISLRKFNVVFKNSLFQQN